MICFLDEEQPRSAHSKYYVFIADVAVQVISGDEIEECINKQIALDLVQDIKDITHSFSDILADCGQTLTVEDVANILDTVNIVNKSTFTIDTFYTNMLREKVISLFANYLK